MNDSLESIQYNTFGGTASANYFSSSTSIESSYIELIKNSIIVLADSIELISHPIDKTDGIDNR